MLGTKSRNPTRSSPVADRRVKATRALVQNAALIAQLDSDTIRDRELNSRLSVRHCASTLVSFVTSQPLVLVSRSTAGLSGSDFILSRLITIILLSIQPRISNAEALITCIPRITLSL